MTAEAFLLGAMFSGAVVGLVARAVATVVTAKMGR